jgi:hypothetical protein
MPKQSVEKRIAVIGAPLLGPIRNRFNEALVRYAGEHKNWRFVVSMEEAVPGTLFMSTQPRTARISRLLCARFRLSAGLQRRWSATPGVPSPLVPPAKV